MGKLKLESTAFKHNGDMPKKYTCQGDEVNPPLKISGVPKKAKSLVLIMTDPDAPIPITVTHWVICHLDSKTKKIKENDPFKNAIVGKNMMRQNKYMGPCPPFGRKHRYVFKLYALDEKLNLDSRSGRRKVVKAMEGRIIEETEFIGLYRKMKDE